MEGFIAFWRNFGTFVFPDNPNEILEGSDVFDGVWFPLDYFFPKPLIKWFFHNYTNKYVWHGPEILVIGYLLTLLGTVSQQRNGREKPSLPPCNAGASWGVSISPKWSDEQLWIDLQVIIVLLWHPLCVPRRRVSLRQGPEKCLLRKTGLAFQKHSLA